MPNTFDGVDLDSGTFDCRNGAPAAMDEAKGVRGANFASASY